MQRFSLVLAAPLLVIAPAAAHGQVFEGSGQRATEFFFLPAGLEQFQLRHEGESGPFVVSLLDERGDLVVRLVEASGRFQGSGAARVPRGGRYVLDVIATGEWRIERRTSGPVSTQDAPDPPSPDFLEGEAVGRETAGAASTAGWFARGLFGGAVAGPIGAAVAVKLAGSSSGDPGVGPPTGSPASPEFRRGWESGVQAAIRKERKKMAFVGGMIGTGVFLAAIIQVVNLVGGTSDNGGNPGGPPPPEYGLARF
jgi:hypothetical protein